MSGTHDQIDLRCPECGQALTPIVNSLMPGKVIALCDACWRRLLARRPGEQADRVLRPGGEGGQ